MSKNVEILPATQEDFEAFSHVSDETPRALPRRGICLDIKVDGRIIALGGVMFLPNGQNQAFADISDEARRYPIVLHKAAFYGISLLKKYKIKRLIATTSSGLERDVRWLLRLGFRPEVGTNNYVLDL